ncbi:DUF1427 family protein [Burkholderia multivorans]|uniref:DUF1427 family protein n=1 Tax=Burkholderia multivorans TaxID=87883 RepID=UPI003B98679E
MADTITAWRSRAAALRSFFLQANPIRSHDFDRTVPAPVGHPRAFLMKAHSFSLLAGLLAVAIDGTLGVNSPASPVIALVGLFGLFGMLAGETVSPLARRVLAARWPDAAWRDGQRSPHMFGLLPGSGTRARKPS